MNSSQWYIVVAGQTTGPIETELVLQGLRQGSVPPSAHVCRVGAAEWTPIADMMPFSDSLRPVAADDLGPSEEEASSLGIGQTRASECEADRAVMNIDWTEPLLGYLVHWEDASLPDEAMLLADLDRVAPDVLIQQQAMWNLALCIAVGSDELAGKASEILFQTLSRFRRPDRLAWVLRALRGKGFVPSGVPGEAAERAVNRLMQDCPPELLAEVSRADSPPN